MRMTEKCQVVELPHVLHITVSNYSTVVGIHMVITVLTFAPRG